MIDLIEHKQNEEIKERLKQIEAKLDEVLAHFNQADQWIKESTARRNKEEWDIEALENFEINKVHPTKKKKRK